MIRDKLKQVFQRTFLDLFNAEESSAPNLEQALSSARKDVESAIDGLAEFAVAHHQIEQRLHNSKQHLEKLDHELQGAVVRSDDAEARMLLGRRKDLQAERDQLARQHAESIAHHDALKNQLEKLKQKALLLQQKKFELELRNRAAQSIEKINTAEEHMNHSGGRTSIAAAELDLLQREARNQIAEEGRSTLGERIGALLEDDDIEQQLATLKAKPVD